MTFGIYVEWWPLGRGTKEMYAHWNDHTIHFGLTKPPAKWPNGRRWIVRRLPREPEIFLD